MMFEEMKDGFEDIMDQESSDEEVLSDDTECVSERRHTDCREKFVSSPEIRALNNCTKH